MSQSNSIIARNTLLLYIRSAIVLVINLYTSRVVLDVLGVDNYGIYNLVGGVVGMFSMIGSTLQAASQRFITFALGKGDDNNLKTVFSTCVTLHIFLGVILIILLEIIGGWMVDNELNIPLDRLKVAKWVFQFSILTFFFNLISVPYCAVIIAHEKMSTFAYISVTDAVFKLLIAILLGFCDCDRLLLYSFLHFIVALIIRVIYTIYTRNNFIESSNVNFRINKSVFKEMFSFSSWNLIGSSALVLRNQGIDVILNIFFDVLVNAAKGIAYQIQGAVQLFIGNLTAAIIPQLTSAIAKDDYNRANNLILHGTRFSFFMMMLIAIPFMMCTDKILDIWLVNPPNYAVEFTQLTIVLLLCDTMTRLPKNGILAQGNIRNFQIIAGGIKLLSLPITYIILKLGGNPSTGFIVNIAIEFCTIGVDLLFINKFLKFRIKRFILEVFIPCWSVLILSVLVVYLFSHYISCNTILVFIISIIVSVGFIMVIIDKKEIDLILKLVKSKSSKNEY